MNSFNINYIIHISWTDPGNGAANCGFSISRRSLVDSLAEGIANPNIQLEKKKFNSRHELTDNPRSFRSWQHVAAVVSSTIVPESIGQRGTSESSTIEYGLSDYGSVISPFFFPLVNSRGIRILSGKSHYYLRLTKLGRKLDSTLSLVVISAFVLRIASNQPEMLRISQIFGILLLCPCLFRLFLFSPLIATIK